MTIQTQTITIAAPQAAMAIGMDVRVALLRREILDNLDRLASLSQQFGQSDSLSAQIQDWATEFRAAAHSPAFTSDTKHFFISQLERLLKDSLPFELRDGTWIVPPLDEEAVLGSDGFVYGKRLLAMRLIQVPEAARRLSPRHPESSEPFFVQPHLPAQFLVRWLREEGGRGPLLEIDGLYAYLFRHRAPFLPVKEDRSLVADDYQAMQGAARAWQERDALSEALIAWIHRFEQTLTLAHEETLGDVLVAELKTLLQNLGDQPLLGSDGHTYGLKQLALLVTEGSWPYTAMPHKLAQHLIHWLYSSRGILIDEPPEVRERYDLLEEQGVLRPIPFSSARLERFRRRAAEQEREDREQLEAILAPLMAVREEAREVGREVHQASQEGREHLEREVARLEAEIQALQQEIVRLHEDLRATGAILSEVEISARELEVSCNQLEQRIAAAEKDSLGGILQAAASIIVTYAVSQVIPGLSAVFQQGGARIGMGVPI